MKEHISPETLILKLLSPQFKIIWPNYFKIGDFKSIDYSVYLFRSGNEEEKKRQIEALAKGERESRNVLKKN